ncbi:MAG: ABC transporter permease, partial [Candidatus Competibacterales bacterium]|nr:ABC transporter permease [Candidatus Competibacterales bacterium]
MNRLLWLSLLRHLGRHRWQLGLAVLGIALGVAVVLAVDLANSSARRSFELASEQLTGRATHRIVGGESGLDETLYRRLRVEAGIRAIAPVVAGHAPSAAIEGRVYQLLGVDPFAEAPFRGHVAGTDGGDYDLAALLTEPDMALLPPDAPPGPLRLALNEGEARL